MPDFIALTRIIWWQGDGAVLRRKSGHKTVLELKYTPMRQKWKMNTICFMAHHPNLLNTKLFRACLSQKSWCKGFN